MTCEIFDMLYVSIVDVHHCCYTVIVHAISFISANVWMLLCLCMVSCILVYTKYTIPIGLSLVMESAVYISQCVHKCYILYCTLFLIEPFYVSIIYIYIYIYNYTQSLFCLFNYDNINNNKTNFNFK